MSLEYAIEYPCRMRERYGEAGLRGLARTSALISKMVNETISNEGIPTRESVEFTARFSRELEQADEVAAYCRSVCPVEVSARLSHRDMNSSSEPIECLGRIRYPVEARFERFLADRLQLIHGTTPGDAWPNLLRILLDPESPFDGEVTKELRRITTADGLRFYELRLPVSLSRISSRLTTDHVFDILAGFTATDGGASGYQREIPPLALGDYADFLDALLWRGMSEAELARMQARSSTFGEYLRFLAALRAASDLGVRLLLD